MTEAKSVEIINDKMDLIQNDGWNIADTLYDWPPLIYLANIYLFFFKKYEKAINEGVTKDYEKEMKKINSSYITKDQTLSPLGRVPTAENLLTIIGLSQRAGRKHAFRLIFIKILDRSFLIAFGIFGCHILLTILNFFSGFLPFMYLAGICFTLAITVMTFIMTRFPKI